MDARAVPNANFTSLGGRSVHDRDDAAYREYRRRWEENPRDFVTGEFPIHLDLEASSRCNLRCTFCDKLPVLTPGQIGMMDFDLFQRIIDQGREGGLQSIKLSYRGEPLLNPRLPDMVRYAKHNGVLDVYFNTNAMLLTEDLVLRLIDSGLNRISVSAEGTTAQTYESMRKGASFSRLLANVAMLREVRERAGGEFPRLRIQTVRLPGIDLESYRAFWLQWADEVAGLDFMDAIVRRDDLVDEHWACPQLWQRMTVEWNGVVNPCNNDDFNRLSPGNARDKTIRDCWLDASVRRIRDLHRSGCSHTLDACRECVWRAAQLKKTQAPHE